MHHDIVWHTQRLHLHKKDMITFVFTQWFPDETARRVTEPAIFGWPANGNLNISGGITSEDSEKQNHGRC